MTTVQINEQLYRPILSGKQFDQLMPSSKCQVTPLGSGDTGFAIKKMALWANKYVDHTEILAPKLDKGNLEDTVNAIQDFLYNHIQYKIDESDQNLLSPACAWEIRETGTDCKSYSIFGSTILLNLGIKHYLRRIKQAQMPEAFTHVYIVVPVNQKSGSLNDGYFTIDGTIQYNNELPFIENDDIKMEPKLATYGLANPYLGCGGINTCGNTYIQPGLGISLDDFSGIFSPGWSPSCIGGTLDKKDTDVFNDAVINGFDALFSQFNNLLVGRNPALIQDQVNLIFLSSIGLLSHAEAYQSHNWSSSCSKAAANGFVTLAKYFNDVAFNAFYPYLQRFFDFTTSYYSTSNNLYPFETYRNGQGLFKDNFVRDIQAISFSNFSIKTGVSIPKFEFTPYVMDNVQQPGFNIDQFLNTLNDVVIQVQGTTGNNQGPWVGSNIDDAPPVPVQAGFGGTSLLLMAGLIGGAIWYGTKKLKK